MKDRWCSKYQMPDGTKISGAAAREARLKAAGGVENILSQIVSGAVNNAFALGRRTAAAAPANDNVVRIVRRSRRA